MREIANNAYDLIFCLEVYEHLPINVIHRELDFSSVALRTNGILIIGVPNELFIPVLIRGIFRMVRRFGAFDANFDNVFLACFGLPPKDRSKTLRESGEYIGLHMGFDHQRFRKFKVESTFGSPFTFLQSRFQLRLITRIKRDQ